MDRTNNSSGEITNQVEVNVYYKNDMERMRMDMCDLGRTDMILEIPWLQVHNHEINWETGEVKITSSRSFLYLLIHFTTVAMRLFSHGPHVTLVM